MSEFSITKKERLIKLKEIALLLLEEGNAGSFINRNKDFISTVIPSDFITLLDEVVKEGYAMEDIKVMTNKMLNIFHNPIRDFVRVEVKADSFLGILEQNNHKMELLLDKLRPLLKDFVKDINNPELQKQLTGLFNQLSEFVKHYTIKENVLFPIIEENWPDYRCLKIMWSFHDDIRRNLNTVNEQLREGKIDLKIFNKCVGGIFFNMLAIKFREERILFPYILSTISESQLETMNREGLELGFPYVNPNLKMNKEEKTEFEGNLVNLGTGKISIDQIKLIFNHLPVDITFVDENNKVCYFSTPPHRIFPRTVAIIGRDVNNCHPPESVHVVEQIVESFRSGTKNHADFWIKMKDKFILIQYFAVRDNNAVYRGVLEVSQEVSDIKALEGEKRLLDW